MFKLKVGTRGSKLSIIQTEEVIKAIKEREQIDVDVIVIKTKGDIDKRTPLYKMKEKGVFERDINLALVRKEIDLAVHSAKDVPSNIPDGIILAAVPPRKSPFDAFVSIKYKEINELPKGARVGTSSLRRLGFLKYFKKDIEVLPIRGNVDTKLKRLDEGGYDGLVVAEAALNRLGFKSYKRLNKDVFVPSAGQGALAVFARKNDTKVLKILSKIDDYKSRFELLLEKKIVEKVKAGCRTPIGVYANFDIYEKIVRVSVATVTTKFDKVIKVDYEGNVKDYNIKPIAQDVAKIFINSGGKDALNRWRELYGL